MTAEFFRQLIPARQDPLPMDDALLLADLDAGKTPQKPLQKGFVRGLAELLQIVHNQFQQIIGTGLDVESQQGFGIPRLLT